MKSGFWCCNAATAAKSLQSCPTLCDPIDSSPSGSPVPGTLRTRTLEWVAISFSSAWKWKRKGKSPSHVQLLATPRTAAQQAPPSTGVSRQKYWSRVPVPSLWCCNRTVQIVYLNCGVYVLSRPTLWNPMDYSPLGSSVHGIFQARMLEWLPFSPPGDLPDPGIKTTSSGSHALAGGFFTTWEAQ